MRQVLGDDAEWCENEIIYGVWERSHTHAGYTQLDDRQNMRDRLTLENTEARGEKNDSPSI